MNNPNEVLIKLYATNRRELSKALTSSGCDAERILNSSEAWDHVMFVLATNSIAIQAMYIGAKK